MIIHLKFKINIWLHCDELDFYHSYQQMKIKSENDLQNKVNSYFFLYNTTLEKVVVDATQIYKIFFPIVFIEINGYFMNIV